MAATDLASTLGLPSRAAGHALGPCDGACLGDGNVVTELL